MAGERVDYTAAAVDAAKSVLIELMHILDHVGPRDAAEFEEALDWDERAIWQRDAFEKVNHLLRQLGMG